MIHVKSVKQRVQNFSAIFEQLKGREFGVHDVAKIIGMTRNASITYRRELLAANVMERTGRSRGNCGTYRLTGSPQDIQAFMDLVADGERFAPPEPAKKRAAKVEPVRAPVVAFRDPLVAFLFGPAGSQAVKC